MGLLTIGLEDGLDPDFNTSEHLDLVAPPIFKSGPKTEVNFITNVNGTEPQLEVTEEQLFGKGIQEGVLPNFDAKFDVINNNRLKVIDLKDVESVIQGNNAISQEDANSFEQVFGGLFNSRLSKNHFTKAPSKTNFDVSLRIIRDRISNEALLLKTEAVNYFSVPMADAELFVSRIEEQFVPNMKADIKEIQSKFEQVLNNISSSKNTILPMGQTTVNILTAPVATITLEESKTLVSEINQEDRLNAFNSLKASVTALQGLLKGHLNYFLFSCLSGKVEISKTHEAFLNENSVTIEDLVKLYQGNSLVAGIEYLEQLSKESLEAFKNLMNEVEESADDFDKLNSFIVENTNKILDVSRNLSNAYKLANNLVLLNISVRQVFNFLRFCL